MKKFGFYQDTKIISWSRTHFFVEAESYEDAVEKLSVAKNKDVWNDEVLDKVNLDRHKMYVDNEQISENKELYPFNGTESTIETYNDSGTQVYSNLDKKIEDFTFNEKRERLLKLYDFENILEIIGYNDYSGFEENDPIYQLEESDYNAFVEKIVQLAVNNGNFEESIRLNKVFAL